MLNQTEATKMITQHFYDLYEVRTDTALFWARSMIEVVNFLHGEGLPFDEQALEVIS